MTEYNNLMQQLHEIKQTLTLIESNCNVIDGWINRKAAMRFFDYGPTQMRSLENEGTLEVARIGHRTFYSIESIRRILEQNKQK